MSFLNKAGAISEEAAVGCVVEYLADVQVVIV